MTLRSRGAAALTRRMQVTDGVSVTYARGARSATVTAWVGNTLFARSTDEPGASVVRGERDYLIPVAGLVLGGEAVTPARGDRITETIGGADVTFEIQTALGEPEWRYSDADRARYRVHVKRVG